MLLSRNLISDACFSISGGSDMCAHVTQSFDSILEALNIDKRPCVGRKTLILTEPFTNVVFQLMHELSVWNGALENQSLICAKSAI
jgi:hypothetical protein